MPVPQWASSGLPLFIFLFFVVFLRAQGTYWLGRGAATGALKGDGHSGLIGAIARWFNGPVPRRGAELLEKWGLLIIPLCFLTVGVQTAVNAGAGIVRLKWRSYTLAMLPGCVAWSIMYGLGLLAVWVAAIGAIAGSPISWIGIALAVIILASWLIYRHSHPKAAPQEVLTCEESPVSAQ